MINNYTSTTNTRGQINAVLDVQETASVYGYGSEPVSLEELKAYAKIDFDDEDSLLYELIITARMHLETYCGLSFIPKRIIAVLQNDCGGIELPYGPVVGTIDTTLITDSAGDEVSIDISGGQFPFIRSQIEYVQLMYDAGYSVLPSPLITAIKAQAFFLYENRGEKLSFGDGGVRTYSVEYICDAAKQLCMRYRRVWDAMF